MLVYKHREDIFIHHEPRMAHGTPPLVESDWLIEVGQHQPSVTWCGAGSRQPQVDQVTVAALVASLNSQNLASI